MSHPTLPQTSALDELYPPLDGKSLEFFASIIELYFSALISEVEGLYAYPQVTTYSELGGNPQIPDIAVLTYQVDEPNWGTFRTHLTPTPPWMFIEITSEGKANRLRDLETKVHLYRDMGVERYMIIDRQKMEIHLHHFLEDVHQIFPANDEFFFVSKEVEFAWNGNPYHFRVRYMGEEIQMNHKRIQILQKEVQSARLEIKKRNRALENKDRVIEDKERALEDKDRVLEDKERALEDKDRILSEYEAEIERLKTQIQLYQNPSEE